MPSPFPGMDPWLERPMLFPSLHNNLITYLQAALNAALPPGYVATQANRVWVDIEALSDPDVSVFGPRRSSGGAAEGSLGGLMAVAVDTVSDPIEEPYLEIHSDEDDRLVTAVEVVSRSNKKAGDSGRTAYQNKQVEYRASGVNLVEIDLLRGGPHTTAVPEHRLRAAAGRFDYHVCVMVAGVPNKYFVAPIRLEDPLPTIPVPLTRDVEPVSVALQPVFDRCYDDGGYARLARYARQRPDPPLTPEQAGWAAGLLRAKGLLPAADGGPTDA